MNCGISRIRLSFQEAIKDLSASISYNDEQYAKTGDPNFAKFRDDNIRTLRELKEFILKEEKKEEERYGQQLELFDEPITHKPDA